jgi:hypothetical protein
VARRSVDLHVPVPAPGADGRDGRAPRDWRIAATVHVPADDVLAGRPPALVAMPGAGYNRRYFDLPAPGYSEAEHHVRQGTIVVAVDHLGTGDSTIPPLDVTTLPTVAAASHAAVTEILDRLRAGTLGAGIPPADVAGVVGAGQSMGGFVLAVMQANHRTFDGVAMLGSSMSATTLPVRPDAPPVVVPDGTPADEAAMLMLAGIDWRWAFHWDDEPHPLVEQDVSGGLPVRHTPPAWGSLTTPGCVNTLVVPGVVAGEVAAIDVPVLLAMGQRDVCGPTSAEFAAFTAATDIAVFVGPRMAHMHNFAGTRELLWDRLDAFVTQIAAQVARRSRALSATAIRP